MIDLRNSYRAKVKELVGNREDWMVQVRRWWWPFWSFVGFAYDEPGARARAALHARGPKRRVVMFGKLPA